MTSRRVSLPVAFTQKACPSDNFLSPSAAAAFSVRRRSHQPNAQMPATRTHRRSLPGTPRRHSPRYRGLPHVDEYACSSSRFEYSTVIMALRYLTREAKKWIEVPAY
ncbi:hypothetical protein GCK32_020164, partial [Trichostrongylus colubriformis]